MTISLEGLLTVGGNEDRALADLKVEHNGLTYLWKRYVPAGVNDLTQWLLDIDASVRAEIDLRESEWVALEPKTRTIEDTFGESSTVDIPKEEIVSPTIPDYYALRRNAYPPIGEQLGATFKGVESPEFIEMQARIESVKALYPKPAY